MPKALFSVKFVGEEGIDYGGLTSNFFADVSSMSSFPVGNFVSAALSTRLQASFLLWSSCLSFFSLMCASSDCYLVCWFPIVPFDSNVCFDSLPKEGAPSLFLPNCCWVLLFSAHLCVPFQIFCHAATAGYLERGSLLCFLPVRDSQILPGMRSESVFEVLGSLLCKSICDLRLVPPSTFPPLVWKLLLSPEERCLVPNASCAFFLLLATSFTWFLKPGRILSLCILCLVKTTTILH